MFTERLQNGHMTYIKCVEITREQRMSLSIPLIYGGTINPYTDHPNVAIVSVIIVIFCNERQGTMVVVVACILLYFYCEVTVLDVELIL